MHSRTTPPPSYRLIAWWADGPVSLSTSQVEVKYKQVNVLYRSNCGAPCAFVSSVWVCLYAAFIFYVTVCGFMWHFITPPIYPVFYLFSSSSTVLLLSSYILSPPAFVLEQQGGAANRKIFLHMKCCISAPPSATFPPCRRVVWQDCESQPASTACSFSHSLQRKVKHKKTVMQQYANTNVTSGPPQVPEIDFCRQVSNLLNLMESPPPPILVSGCSNFQFPVV